MNIYIHKITISIQSNYIFYRILFNYKAFKIVREYFLFLNTVLILILYINIYLNFIEIKFFYYLKKKIKIYHFSILFYNLN